MACPPVLPAFTETSRFPAKSLAMEMAAATPVGDERVGSVREWPAGRRFMGDDEDSLAGGRPPFQPLVRSNRFRPMTTQPRLAVAKR